MKTPRKLLFLLFLAELSLPVSSRAQSTAFTYQGRLDNGGAPYTGSAEFQATLWNAASGGSQLAANSTAQIVVAVTNGLFVLPLDFGANFPGAERWVQLTVRTVLGPFTPLSPRQRLTATPYAITAATAITANNLSGNVAASQLTGIISANNIGPGSITTVMLASGAVTTGALADGAVTAGKVASVSDWFARTIANPRPGVGDLFGASVAAVGSDRMVIGAYGDDTGATGAGAAYLFSSNGTLLTTLTNPAPAVGDQFGAAVAGVGSDRILIGAQGDDTGATDAGVAYLFSDNGTLLTTFTNPTPGVSDRFGDAVAAVGNDRVLIGAYLAQPGGLRAGAAYLFSTGGTLLTTFNNPTPAADDVFGASVAAVGNDRVLIGATSDDTGAQDAGAAYLFSTNGTLLTTFTNPTPANFDAFGSSVAAVGSDRVLIGANFDDTSATDAGAAYLFSTNGTLLTTFTNPAPASRDFFGSSVAAVGSDRVLIGATADDTGAQDAGAAYLFSVEAFVEGLVADGLRPRSVSTASLQDGAITLEKLAPTVLLWSRSDDDVFRVPGNVGIGTAAPRDKLHVAGDLLAGGSALEEWLFHTRTAFGGDFLQITDLDGGVPQWQRGLIIHQNGAVGINTTAPQQELHVIGDILASGTITPNSDRNLKTGFAPVDTAAVLDKVVRLPIQQWRFKTEPDEVKHVGPMAQDFRAAFGLGEMATAIATVDADGVALAAIQGLNQKVKAKAARIAELERRIEKLERLMNGENGGGR